MDEFRKHLYEAQQRSFDRLEASARHSELIHSQAKLIDSNIKVAEEVHGIRDTLQTQIDDNRKNIEANKLTEEKHDKRSKHEFRLSFAVAIVSAAIALAALFVAIFK